MEILLRFEFISLYDKENNENNTLEEPLYSDKINRSASENGFHKTFSLIIKGKIVKRDRGCLKKFQIIKIF